MIFIKYEKKFTVLAKYAITFIMNEEDNCKRFQGGLRTKNRTPVTANANFLVFPKLVEAIMCVERCLAEGVEKKNLRGKTKSKGE